MPLGMTLEVFPHLFLPVGFTPIPQKQQGTRQVTAQVTEKPQYVGASDVLLGVERQIEVDAAAMRRNDQSADGGDLLMTPLPYGEGGRQAARGPSAAQERRHQKARFV